MKIICALSFFIIYLVFLYIYTNSYYHEKVSGYDRNGHADHGM